MAIFKLQHAFQAYSGSSKDLFVNTFHFVHDPDPDDSAMTSLFQAVKFFYGSQPGSENLAVNGYMSNYALGPGRTIKLYEVAGPPPHPPLKVDITQGAAGSNAERGMPEEVAACLSFEGLSLAGTKQARRRGRIYLGPLNFKAMEDEPAEAHSCLKANLGVVATKAAKILAGSALAAGWTWVIYSPTNGNAVTISRVWMDNAFDTVRGRGGTSTARVVEQGAPFEVAP